MYILHVMKESSWKNICNDDFYGEECIEIDGFIHCSDIHSFYLVAPHFANIQEPLVLLCIDVDSVRPTIKWEDQDNCGTAFPHIYGLLNIDAVKKVLPYLKDNSGNWIMNDELKIYCHDKHL